MLTDEEWFNTVAYHIEQGSKLTVQRMGGNWTTSMTSPRRKKLAALLRLALSIPESPIKPTQPVE